MTDLEGTILTSYLQDCGGSDSVMDCLRRARCGLSVPDWSGNCVFVEFYSDRIVVSHQWIFDGNGCEAAVAISLDDAESILQAEASTQAFAMQRVVTLPLAQRRPESSGTVGGGV